MTATNIQKYLAGIDVNKIIKHDAPALFGKDLDDEEWSAVQNDDIEAYATVYVASMQNSMVASLLPHPHTKEGQAILKRTLFKAANKFIEMKIESCNREKKRQEYIDQY